MTVAEIRASLVALIARIDGAAPAPAAQAGQRPGTNVQQVTVAGWQVKQSKAGNSYGRLTTNTGAVYPVFERTVLALDPIPLGSKLEITTQSGVDKEGKPFEKVVGARMLQASAFVVQPEEIPF